MALIGISVGIIGAGAVLFAVTRPNPAEELTDAAKALEGDWASMPVDALVAKWFAPSLTAARRARLDRIFARRKWSSQRPAIRYVLDEMRHDEIKGRSEYEIEGFPKDRLLTIFWDRANGSWKVSAPKIPILEEK